jgi:hypothetical protein
LLLFTALGISAGHLISLIFSILDLMLPDPADYVYLERYAADRVRWAIAALIVSVPPFVSITLYTNRKIAQDAGHQRSFVRKWLTYLAHAWPVAFAESTMSPHLNALNRSLPILNLLRFGQSEFQLLALLGVSLQRGGMEGIIALVARLSRRPTRAEGLRKSAERRPSLPLTPTSIVD